MEMGGMLWSMLKNERGIWLWAQNDESRPLGLTKLLILSLGSLFWYLGYEKGKKKKTQRVSKSGIAAKKMAGMMTVSYTHLTLPTKA